MGGLPTISWNRTGSFNQPPYHLLNPAVGENVALEGRNTERNRAEVVPLAYTRYPGTNHTHLTELLAEREAIVLGRSTVRRILMGVGMTSLRRRRPPRHRVRRQRMPREGVRVQIDESHHPWLAGCGPKFVLILAIDDATGTVPNTLSR